MKINFGKIFILFFIFSSAFGILKKPLNLPSWFLYKILRFGRTDYAQRRVNRTNSLEKFVYIATKQKLDAVNRYNLSFSGVSFELLFKKATARRLFVFLSSGGRVNGDTTTLFNRHKWAPDIDGNCLFIEDPCIKLYPGITTGWFYGTSNVSFAHLANDITDALRKRLNIPVEDVFFVGSSSGGYAALYMADQMQGATAICENPQFYLHLAGSHSLLERISGIRISDTDPFQRAGIGRILRNNRSRFYIEVNRNSPQDFDRQLKTLLSENHKSLSGKVNYFDRSLIVVNPFDFSLLHHTFSLVNEFNMLFSILTDYWGGESEVESKLDEYLHIKQERFTAEDARRSAK